MVFVSWLPTLRQTAALYFFWLNVALGIQGFRLLLMSMCGTNLPLIGRRVGCLPGRSIDADERARIHKQRLGECVGDPRRTGLWLQQAVKNPQILRFKHLEKGIRHSEEIGPPGEEQIKRSL